MLADCCKIKNMSNSGADESLSLDAYDSIAFKGQSAQYLAQVIEDVLQLSRSGTIYPPAFATWRNPVLEHGLSPQPHYKEDGMLSPAEAVAVKVVADEGSALAQNLFENYDKTMLISELVGNPDGWPSDVVDGIAHFGYSLCGAIRIREKIARGEAIPTGRTIGDDLIRNLWQRYQEPLKLDNMIIGKNTVTEAVKSADELVEREIRGVPEGAKNEEELQVRMRSRRRGIELGAKIYNQVLDVAIQRGLPTTLERIVDEKIVVSP
jgi:hypothetical protein